jgi:hypothetical protein
LLAGQLALALVRAIGASAASSGEGRLRAKVTAALPFADASQAARGRVTDLARPQRSQAPARRRRLRQTVVALMAAATVVEAARRPPVAPRKFSFASISRPLPLAEKADIALPSSPAERGGSARRSRTPGARRDDLLVTAPRCSER